MLDCFSSSPLSLSITRQLGFLSTSGRTSVTSRVMYGHNELSYPKLCSTHRRSILTFASGRVKRSSTDGPHGELGFKEDDGGGCGDESFRSRTKGLDLGAEERAGEVTDDEGKPDETLPLRSAEEGDLVQVEGKGNEEMKMRRGRQLMRRSNLMAKQVISISSALSLGFVSQLWVDAATVGDVVLVENEEVLDNDLKMLGLDTLVGYEVVTPGSRTIGKVRGYTFNINSGAVESLELDSFGISIIPSSLVSTYALFLEDVLEVASDRVVVHEAAASRIQRLTKGLWGNQKTVKPVDEYEDYSEFEKPVSPSKNRRTRRGSRSRKFHPKVGETEDDWDLPMDFF